MRFKIFASLVMVGLGVSAAQEPIKLAIWKGVGPSRYWHDCINTGVTQIQNIFTNPAGATNIRDKASMVIPPQGFSVRVFGVTNTGTPTDAQRNAFFAYLDTADVILYHAAVDFGGAIGTNTANRQKLADFFMTKGAVSLHASTDSYETWAALDTIQAARFRNHSNANTIGTLYKDSLPENTSAPGFNALNLGLWEPGDTTRFVEEWFSFWGTSAAIRAKSQLRVLMTIREGSYSGAGSGWTAMGADHPMAWFRNFTNGGRFFYSAVGHRYQNYTGVTSGSGTANATTDFFRRQIYNAVLWAAKYDGPVAIRPDMKAPGEASNYSKLSITGSSLRVDLLQEGDHAVDLLTVSGRRVASQKGVGRITHTFENLRPGVYALAVTTSQGRSNRLVTMR